MSDNNKVIWSEGLLLRPQHFQQHDRYLESLVNGRCLGLKPYAWGFFTLTLNQELLKIGKLALVKCQGVFPDGTPFNLPEDGELPLPLDIPENCHQEQIFLALPVHQSGAIEADSNEYPESLARFRASEYDVKDCNGRDEMKAPIHVGKLKTRLMLAREERAGYTCLGVARVIEARADKNVILDDEYIPANLNCFAIPRLGGSGGFLRELHGLLNTRGAEFARVLVNPGSGGTAEISDFLLLQLINRYQPLFGHLADVVGLHPEDFYRSAIQLAGELATFVGSERRPAAFTTYDHEDLQSTFSDVMKELRQLLHLIGGIDRRAIALELQGPQYGIYAAKRPDAYLLENAVFVLAAHADVPPKTLETNFPLQVKIGPLEEVRQLIDSSSRGIAIHHLPTPPRQLPVHADFTYFALSKNSELWGKLLSSRGFAIFVSERFPGLQLEFWAIKES
jgi:type VI secretion system protein ImpJ